MADIDLLTKLIFERGLCQPKATAELVGREAVTNDDELLASIAGVAETGGKALAAIVAARINSIASDLVRNASPAEVIIYRQAMLEVAMLIDDVEFYAAEYKRRKQEKESNTVETDTSGAEPAPKIEDNVSEPGTT